MHLRTASRTRLAALSTATVAALGVGIAAAGGAFAGATSPPPPKPLATAVHDALSAPAVAGVSARIRFTNDLLPSTSGLGPDIGGPLLSGATGRLWATQDGRFRLELQSDNGDAQIASDGKRLVVYDAHSNTLYTADLPQDQGDSGASAKDAHGVPSLGAVTRFLDQLGGRANVSGAQPSAVAGRPAYTVRVSPRSHGGLVGGAELAWDAATGVPLRAAVYATGVAQPILELTATDVSFGSVDQSALALPSAPGAKVVHVDLPAGRGGHDRNAHEVTGLRAVQARLPFTLSAPATLAGRPRSDVRLVDVGDAKGALVTYGQGLDGLVVLEHPAPAPGSKDAKPGAGLPPVLETALGTVVQRRAGNVTYLVAGSVPKAVAQAAAAAL